MQFDFLDGGVTYLADETMGLTEGKAYIVIGESIQVGRILIAGKQIVVAPLAGGQPIKYERGSVKLIRVVKRTEEL